MIDKTRSPRLYATISKGTLRRFAKHTIVSSTDEGDDIMLVVKGYVKRYAIRSDGSLGVQIIYGSQGIFALTKVFRTLLNLNIYNGPETFYYETMADTEIYVLPLSTFAEAAQKDPALYKELFVEAGYHLKVCVHGMESVSLRSTYARVAHNLVFILREFGEDTSEGVQLRAPITHQDIADILGITRTTVTLAIVKLRNGGLVLPSRPLTVPDLERLTNEAYS